LEPSCSLLRAELPGLPPAGSHVRCTSDCTHNREMETSPHDNNVQHLVAVAASYLQQANAVLRKVSDKDLSTTGKTVEGTIGQHLRHVLQHFDALIAALSPAASTDSEKHQHVNLIRYDVRRRNLALEKNVDAALEAVNYTITSLQRLRNRQNCGVMVEAIVLPEQSPILMESTLERELWFCCHHAIHHFALIKGNLCDMGKNDVGLGFGVAPSTIKFRAGI